MAMNSNIFLSDIDSVVLCYENKDEEGCKKALRHLINNTPYLGIIIYSIIHEADTNSIQFSKIAKALSIVHKYSMDDETKIAVTELIVGCYARAFSVCPIKERHKIAYDIYCFLDNIYYTRYYKDFNKHTATMYCTHLDDFFANYYLECDEKCAPIYKNEPILVRLIQWYILCHIKQLYEISPLYISINPQAVQSKIKEFYKLFFNIEKSRLKKYVIQLLTEVLENCNSEDFTFDDIEVCYLYNENDKIECHDEELEARIEAEEEYNDYLQGLSYSTHEDNDEDDECGSYRGSYAQDEMGYTDDDIDTIFDGDPSAYWNID